MASYSNVSYWNQRYIATAKDKPCEWYRGYRSLRHLLSSAKLTIKSGITVKSPPPNGTLLAKSDSTYFPPQEKCRVLILGCGNSTFGEDMLRDGWTGKIVNVDFSDAAVCQMRAKYNESFYNRVLGDHSESQKMEFICADITDRFPFEDGSFDLIVCKASFDAVLSGSKANIRSLVAESNRVLSHGHGVFFLVTSGNPDSRLEYLEYKNNINHYWQGVGVHKIPSGMAPEKDVFVYICRKQEKDPDTDKENVSTD